MKALIGYPEKCTGCHRCELWCSLRHEGVNNPSKARIHVIRREPRLDVPLVCQQCGICIKSCPFESISYSGAAGAVVIDKQKCKNCGKCISSCPYGMITWAGEEKKVVKCDLCGGNPECVKHCREKAIDYIDSSEVAAKRREIYAASQQSPSIRAGAALNVHR